MKKNKLVNRLLVILSLSALAISCSDDDSEKAGVGFAGIGSSYIEGDGDATILIPFVNGSVSESDLIIDGSATEDEDYEIVGVTDEGIEVKLLDDTDCEGIEKIRFRIANASGTVNAIHIVNIVSNNNESTTAQLAGTYIVDTDDWEDFGEGDELTVEAVDATHIRIVEYPATSRAHAGIVITINNLITGVGTVESQNSGGYTAGGFDTATSGTAQIRCPGTISLTLDFLFTNAGASNGVHAGNSLVIEKVE